LFRFIAIFGEFFFRPIRKRRGGVFGLGTLNSEWECSRGEVRKPPILLANMWVLIVGEEFYSIDPTDFVFFHRGGVKTLLILFFSSRDLDGASELYEDSLDKM